MNCEKCGRELASSAIICRVCNHNNARRAVSQWRARKTGDLQEPQSTPHTPTSSAPRIISNKEVDANLLRFPASSLPSPGHRSAPAIAAPAMAVSAVAGAVAETVAIPAWREQVKEKVRLVREKRQQELPASPSAPEPPPIDKNPIVESAIKRIRRAEATPAILVCPARNSAQPVLWREDEEIEERPKPIPYPQTLPPIAPRVEERFLTPPRTQPVKRTTKPLSDQTTGPETRTLIPRKNPFAPTSKPEAKPRAAGDSVTLKPRSWPSADQDGKDPEKNASHQESAQVATEIIEMTHAVSALPLPEARPATLWLRTLAGACDFEIIATAYLPLFFAYATLNTSLGGESLFVMAVLMAAYVFIYQLVMLLVAGRTFGMAMLGLNLVNTDDDEVPVTRRQKMLRAWAATFTFLVLPLNLLITRLNHSNRSLPDLVSGTTIAKR